jgi:hypothetical protein
VHRSNCVPPASSHGNNGSGQVLNKGHAGTQLISWGRRREGRSSQFIRAPISAPEFKERVGEIYSRAVNLGLNWSLLSWRPRIGSWSNGGAAFNPGLNCALATRLLPRLGSGHPPGAPARAVTSVPAVVRRRWSLRYWAWKVRWRYDLQARFDYRRGRMRNGERSTMHAFNRARVADSSSTHYD